MKKPGILLLVFFSIIINATSQLRTAIAGGAHTSSVLGNNNPGWDTLNYNYSSRTGFHIGLNADLPFTKTSKFYFQPGIFYTNKGRKLSTSFDSASSTVTHVKGQQFVNYFEIPVNLLFKLKLGKKSKIMIGGGPYASFLYNGRETKDSYYKNGSVQSTENKDLKVATSQREYNNFDFGVNGLFGFEFGRLFITANYSQGLNDFYQATNNSDAIFRHRVMGGTIGIFLGNPGRKSKTKDTDKDGVPDILDECAILKGTVATKGCPDKDEDGIADKEDKCPDQTGFSRHNGCPPPDSDKDGIYDENDKCPQVAGSKKYDGCPIPDTDSDGVNDEEDKCPDLGGSKKYNGCPVPDTDKDGVNDDEDKCPSSKGLKANYGCPEISQAIIKKVNNAARRIQFNYRSTTLTAKSKIVLDGVVKILKDNPELNVFIEGYTSSDGNPNNHFRLSQARAESVKIYFESRMIDPERLKAEGFGDANQLNSGRTESLRALSRRVELKLTNHW